MQITFGTDGWRGIIAKDFTLDNLKIVARATANFLYWSGKKELEIYKDLSIKNCQTYCPPQNGVVIGFDTRFMSDIFAKEIAQEIAKCGIPVYLSSSYTPSPALAYAVKSKNASIGIMVTGSHNPSYYSGIKYKAEYGGTATPEIISSIEKMLHSNEKYYPDKSLTPCPIQDFSPTKPYIKNICDLVDMERIANSRFKIISDPIHGCAIGIMEQIFRQIGSYIEEIRNEENPNFGGYNPEPVGRNIAPLVRKVLRSKADIGFAFDGDADTIGVVDSLGSFVQPHEIFALVLWHLVENRKWTGGVATTFSTSRLTESLTNEYGLPIYETPVGFKHITELMLGNDILIGGEESGGIGIKNSIPDKNAALIALLVLEAMAYSGKGLDEIIYELSSRFGTFCFHRTDIKFETNEEKEKIINLMGEKTPSHFDGTKVTNKYTLDGIKYILEDKSWILCRPSGTEPIFRIYVESTSHQKANRILNECESLAASIIEKYKS